MMSVMVDRKVGLLVQGLFEALVRRCEHKAYNLVYRMIGNHSDATRVLQFALTDAHTRFEQAADEIWLMRIVVRICLEHLGAAQSAFADTSPVHRALAGLTPEGRLLVVLHDLLRFDYEQIGRILRVDRQVVLQRLHLARRHLRGAVSTRTA